ncbi:MAG: hypothetical protein Q9205_003346, partial [Flavoplaca limonia]
TGKNAKYFAPHLLPVSSSRSRQAAPRSEELTTSKGQFTDYTWAEPGGFLQWDEIDVGAYRSQSSDAAVPAKASEQLIGYFLQYMRHLTLDSDWVSHLPTHLTLQGFEIIEWTKLQDHDATYKLETDDHLMVLEDQLPNIAVFMAEKAGRPCAEARQDLERLFRAVARETERGVDLRMDWYCCVARKC